MNRRTRRPFRSLPLSLGVLLVVLAAPAHGMEPSEGAVPEASADEVAAPAPAPATDLFAGPVTEANAAARLVGGLAAVGGIGDYALGNGTLCAVVSNPAHPTDLSPSGGFLLDLGHCALGNDQLANLIPLANVDRANVPVVEEVTASFDDREARVTTRARWQGIVFETDYVLDTVDPESLRMETRVERVASGGRLAVVGLLSVHPNASLRAFTFDTTDPRAAVGFDHPPTPSENLRSLLGGLKRSDVQVLVGAEAGGAGISYGIHLESAWREDEDGERKDLPHVALNGEPFSLLGVFSKPFRLGGNGRVGVLQLAQAPLMNLPEDERLQLNHRIHVGARADVASVTDRLFADGPEVTGHVDEPAARLHVSRDGRPVTHVKPGPDGRFAFRLPTAGSYEVRAVAPGGTEVRLPLEVAADGLALGRIALGGTGRALLPRGHAMRLTFLGLDGTPDPRFDDDLIGLRFGGEEVPNSALASYVSLAGSEDDPASVPLSPGRYRVIASRGLEWSVEETTIQVRSGRQTPLTIGIPRRQVETPGWIQADLHVHAGGSFDSSLTYRERIRSFVAQGGEILVATEHDNVVDYQPVVEAMGLADRVRVVPGLEVTAISKTGDVPYTAGHANAWPLPPEPYAHRGGALRSQGVRLRVPIAQLRARGGRRIFQLNHPRMQKDEADDEALFTHLSVAGTGFVPTRPLADSPNHHLVEPDPETGTRDLDYDAVELLNGKTGPDLAYYKRVRADWFSLLLQGERHTGTANSDSHEMRQLVAIPTNYVKAAVDRVDGFDPAAFVDAVLAGALVGSTGPFLSVDLVGAGRSRLAGPGGTFSGSSGELIVSVAAADWVPVDTLRVYLNGALHESRAIAPGETVRIPLAVSADTFVTVEVQGDPAGEAGERYRAVAPGFVPFAFSNPIFLDADGDGVFTAPGLVAPLPATVTDPLGS